MQIREVTPQEYETLGMLTVDAYRSILDEPLGDYEHELRDVAGRAADSVVLVAIDDLGTVLGGVTYVPGSKRAMSEFADDDAAGIRMLAVDPRHQGEGVGRALVMECIRLARAEGRARLVLHSTIYMIAAQALYRSLGFERAPDRDVSITDEPYEPFLLVAFILAL